MKNTYNIEGVKCGGGVATVKDKLSKLENVDSVEVSIQEKTLTVVGDVAKESLQAALSDTKFKIN